MVVGGHRKSTYVFIALGVCLVALAAALNVGWIVLNWRTGVLLVLGVLFFAMIIAGVVLNTIFLVREIRRNEQHDSFINAVTHELKTPLASIRLYLETLQKHPIDDQRRQDFYRIMLADSDRLQNTIEQVLRAGRLSRSRQLNRSQFRLDEVLGECLELARARYDVGPEAVDYGENRARGVVVTGDPDELRAAILNLIDNAVKYSGKDVHVRLLTERPNPGVVAVRVRDNGVGISPPELKRIFGRFYRIPGALSHRVKGTGIGLFIVRSVAKRHGGRAYAESAGEGRGSTFTLELPVSK